MAILKTCKYSQIPDSFFSSKRLTDDDASANVSKIVQDVIYAVQKDGDKAVRSFAQKFDVANPSSLQIPPHVLQLAADKLQAQKPNLYKALCHSRDLAIKFATKQKECFTDFTVSLSDGIVTGQKTIPVSRAGVYVPAGRFPLLSSVVMCVTPAKAAGVKEVILCTPPRKSPNGTDEPYADEGIMAAAAICGVDKVFACGGAQAIAAMAYGTESIPQVDVIAGPGNKFVAEAKRQVYGKCGIDMLAGPTEVLIIADKSANAKWLAADLLAQAEHDVDAQAVLVTTSAELAKEVDVALQEELANLSTKETASASILKHGLCILVDNLDEAALIANKKAPEHLELALSDGFERDELVQKVHNYGSLFIGHHAAEVLGDYAAGLNHTLPTSGSARFTGGLSVRVFLKTVTTLEVNNPKGDGYKASLSSANELGTTEGLSAHAYAARIRQ